MQMIHIGQAKRLVKMALEAKLVPNLAGSPGVGKSDIIHAVAEEYNLQVIDFRLAQADPTDLNGFPTLNEDRTRSHFAAPGNIPLQGDPLPKDKDGNDKDGWLLFFDEMNAAPQAVQAASYKVILDRMIGDTPIHSKVAMVAAGNLATDKAIVHRTSTAMQSRLVHLNLETDVKAWVDWAIKNKIDHRIVAFINFKNELLHNFDPNHSDSTFACPRTWAFLSRIVKNVPVLDHTMTPIMAGTVGEGAAIEFQGFSEIYQTLPTLKSMIHNPDKVDIPRENPSVVWAIASLIGANADDKNIGPLMKLTNRLDIEFQVITIQGVLANSPKLQTHPEVSAWVSANASELFPDED
jgi:hypothetical protein